MSTRRDRSDSVIVAVGAMLILVTAWVLEILAVCVFVWLCWQVLKRLPW